MKYQNLDYVDGGNEEWRNDAGELHRLDGPAVIERDSNTGVAFFLAYFVNGKRHRVGGPAIIWRDRKTGQVTCSFYFVHGQGMLV